MKMKVGHKLHMIRDDRRMSQEEFADMLGMPTSTYSRLERNETSIAFEKLSELSEKLDVPLQEFLPDNLTVNNNDIKGGGVFLGSNYHTINNYYGGESEIIKQKDEELERLRKEIASLKEKVENKGE